MRKKIKQACKEGFSLIELMIVIVILGALTAIILPQFDASESEAKDTGCDASNYGTIDQLTKYRSINGVYPSRFHNGFENAAATTAMGATADVTALAEVTATNLVGHTVAATLTVDQADSLAAAGIDILASGGFGMAAAFTTVAEDGDVRSITSDWFEGHGAAGAGEAGTEVTINGLPIFAYAASDPQLDYDPADDDVGDLGDVDGVVVPLFVAPTVDWDHAVIDGDSFDSRIGVAQVGGCPWLEAGEQFRYYITFFKVFNNGDAAKLIGTACPECGSLNP